MKKDNNTLLSSFEQFTSKNAKILWGVLAVILIALPFVVKNQYFLTVVAKIGCYAILGLGLNILTGYTGLVSLGHAGFVAIGAYTASLLAVTLGWSFFPAMLAGMLVAAVIGVLVGLPTLRVTGTYLSIITLGFGEIVKMVLMNWQDVTNGTLGVKNIPKPQIFGIKLTVANNGMYFLILIMIVLISLFCKALIQSKAGRALRAIKTDEMASTMMGINITKYKLLAFSISAALAGVAGVLYAHNLTTLTALPKNFGYNMSIMILVYVVLGGIGSIRGSVISTVILYLLPELLRGLNNYRMLIYAIVLILAMLFNSAPQFITLRKRIFGGLKPQHAAHSGKEEA